MDDALQVAYTTEITPTDPVSFVLNVLRYTCVEGNRCFYVYGGALRDTLRSTVPRDIDVYIEDDRNVVHFCTFLKSAGVLRKETKYVLEKDCPYYFLRLEIATVDVLCCVNLSSEMSGDDRYTSCDFTCNNLRIDASGRLSTRLPSPNGTLPPAWTVTCVCDAVGGTLTWMVPDTVTADMSPKEYNVYQQQMCNRLNYMLQKGFSESKIALTGFQCKPLLSYKYTTSCTCPVCKERYSERPSKDTLVLKCGHNFHLECIDNWVMKQRYHSTCPVCRSVVEVSYA